MLQAGYKKLKPLGKGSLGTVWLLENESNMKKYAAKFISYTEIEEDYIKEEVVLLKRLKNPYLIEYACDFKDEYENSHIILMEYCASNTSKKLNRGKFEASSRRSQRKKYSYT